MIDNITKNTNLINKTRVLQEENKLRRIKKEQSLIRSNRNDIFCDLNETEQKKYLPLFENKDNYTSKKYETFWILFEEFGMLQSKKDNHYNFSGIIFPFIEQFQNKFYTAFSEKENKKYIDFSDCIFSDDIYLSSMTFKLEVMFQGAIFKKIVDFSNVTFQQTANFTQVTFEGNTYFNECAFMDFISFEDSEAKGIFDFSDVAFSHLSLDKSTFPKASYLRLDGWNKKIYDDIAREQLTIKHFTSKETARIIKTHFEKENNIIESNTYYPIEMDKYREEIVSYYTSPVKAFFTNQDYFVLTLNKYISNYYTSWLRVLGWIIFFALVVVLTHEHNFIRKAIFDIPYTFDGILTTINYLSNQAVKLIDPFRIFRSTEDIYRNHEALGFIIRIITLYLFWQFIVAFRQNTRRK